MKFIFSLNLSASTKFDITIVSGMKEMPLTEFICLNHDYVTITSHLEEIRALDLRVITQSS
jgi:hypothetical protein